MLFDLRGVGLAELEDNLCMYVCIYAVFSSHQISLEAHAGVGT